MLSESCFQIYTPTCRLGLMLNVVAVVAMIAGALLIVLHATWLLVIRLRSGSRSVRSFTPWVKHLFEAIRGIIAEA